MSILLIAIALVAFVLGSSVLIDVNKNHKDDAHLRIFFSIVGVMSTMDGALLIILSEAIK